MRSACWLTQAPCTCKYQYGQGSLDAKPTPPVVAEIGKLLSNYLGYNPEPDGINCNLYRGPSSSLGWHCDDEEIITSSSGEAYIISLSLGAIRLFERRKKHAKVKPPFITIRPFDVIVMEKKTQLYYEHRHPAVENTFAVKEPRVNLTFRFIQKHIAKCPLKASS